MHTIKEFYPLPRIDDTIDTLHNANWFTTIDLAEGYYQIGVKESDKIKTGFTTHQGTY